MPPTKTLYTPVFFSSSEPPPPPLPPSRGSNSKSTTTTTSSYLTSLSRTHIALAQIVQEVPCSRPGSPTEDSDGSYPDLATQERIAVLRTRVREAWRVAEGNPADGRWTVVKNLLGCMNVTSGKGGRWAGTRVDLKVPEPPLDGGGWINADTEAEWAEWEKRVCLKDKVENWKMRLEVHEELDNQKDTQGTATPHQEEEEASIPTPAAAAAAVQPPNLSLKASTSKNVVDSNPLKDNSFLGFSVIKRSNSSIIGKKPLPPPPKNNDSSNPVNQSLNESTTTSNTIRKKIVDIPETSFLPPSFPSSQVMTSTPIAKPNSSNKHKPEPIPFTESPPLLPAGSITAKVHGRSEEPLTLLLEKSTSLPAIPLTTTTTETALLPPLPTTPTRDTINQNNKRQTTDSPNRIVKKARTMSYSLDSPSQKEDDDDGNTNHPTTPKRRDLPTLTELLASASASSSAKKVKKMKVHSPKGLLLLKPNSAVAGADDDDCSTTSKSKFRLPSSSSSHHAPLSPTEDNPYMLDPYAISVNHSDLDNLGIVDLTSPTKSLSSLAGSDSEVEEEEEGNSDMGLRKNFSLNPYITSTQQHPKAGFEKNGGGVESFGFGSGVSGGYNSQFDVASQIDKVDKLLEKDVDYEGWLRDPNSSSPSEREEEEVESP